MLNKAKWGRVSKFMFVKGDTLTVREISEISVLLSKLTPIALFLLKNESVQDYFN